MRTFSSSIRVRSRPASSAASLAFRPSPLRARQAAGCSLSRKTDRVVWCCAAAVSSMVKRLPTENLKKWRDKFVICVTRCMNNEIPCRSGSPDRSTELVRRHRTSPIKRRSAPWGSRPSNGLTGLAGGDMSSLGPHDCAYWDYVQWLARAEGMSIRTPGPLSMASTSAPSALPGGHVHSCGLILGDMSSPGRRGVGILGLCPVAARARRACPPGGERAPAGDSGPRQQFRRRQTWSQRDPMQS